jgi:methyl-accepting chemotaxis protein
MPATIAWGEGGAAGLDVRVGLRHPALGGATGLVA